MNETALKVLKKINSNGYQAYLVGGYPRDIYIGRNSMDFDICTSATPKQLKKYLVVLCCLQRSMDQ